MRAGSVAGDDMGCESVGGFLQRCSCEWTAAISDETHSRDRIKMKRRQIRKWKIKRLRCISAKERPEQCADQSVVVVGGGPACVTDEMLALETDELWAWTSSEPRWRTLIKLANCFSSSKVSL